MFDKRLNKSEQKLMNEPVNNKNQRRADSVFSIHTFFNNQKFLRTLQTRWLGFLKNIENSDEPVCIALSGGRVASELFDSFASITLKAITEGRLNSKTLNHLHFFWADERCAPPDSSESNFYAANRHLFQPLKIKQAQIHRIKGELPPDEAVAAANDEFFKIAGKKKFNKAIFDLVILGMGEDGHVASLFPDELEKIGQNVPENFRKMSIIYRHVIAVKPPPNRITLDYEPIIKAKRVWVVIKGGNKENALSKSMPPHFATPLGRILKERKTTFLFYNPF